MIILIIYDSNRQTLAAKIADVSERQRSTGSMRNSDATAMMESVQKLMRDIKENPDDFNLNVQAGNAFFDIGRYNQAIQYYKKAISISHDENVMVDLGVCYFNTGKLDSALTAMQNALQHDSDHKQALYNIGIVYYNLNNIDDALKYWQFLIQSHPETDEAKRVEQYINEIKNRQNGS